MNASFEEKSAWIQLFSLVAVLGSYFIVAAMLLSDVAKLIFQILYYRRGM